jgi:STE24 endopeptidase
VLSAAASPPAQEILLQGPFVVGEASALARAWDQWRDGLWLAEQGALLLLPLLLLLSPLGVGIRRKLDGWTGGRRLLTASLYAGLYALLITAVRLPLSAVRRHVAELFGLSSQDWGAWAIAQAGAAAALVVGGLVLGLAAYLLFKRWPRLWPLQAGALILTGVVGVLLAQPSMHDLRPVADPELQRTVARLAERAGASGVRVVIRSAEREQPCGGATVLGLGPTKTLAIDTGLLRHHTEREVAQTIAHELKHYVRNDDWRALYAAIVITVSGLLVLFLASHLAIRWGGRRLGLHDLADPASLPLLALVLMIFSLTASAAFHRYGRHIEQEADRFSLELTQDGVAQAALMQRYLQCARLYDPDASWIERTFQRRHPSFRERIAFARDYTGPTVEMGRAP